ncbi:MAG TPA: superoxide dismutase family protein [Actinophytocola sp.]|uniref:superoxide dismutase family protein n=1 Tax=Actinophytocola sp. TaxID=1872138 RepID=UPI002DDCF2A5|nr:superoxide dismutase family protein [Actinophytocola sp.]HEV2778852.1 superoxide dismutase family protein [Actinophytocola sp.]
MRKTRTARSMAFLAILGAVVAQAVATASVAQTDTADHRVATATVRNANGATLGTLTILDAGGGKLAISGRFTGLTAGFHGFHVHAIGICDPRATDPTGNPAPFTTAGPHLDDAGSAHGNHDGDLPLLLVNGDGTTATATVSDRLTPALLFDADRSAIIIHALPDNYAHIPTRYSAAGVPGPDAATLATGDAGGRFACGVIVRG